MAIDAELVDLCGEADVLNGPTLPRFDEKSLRFEPLDVESASVSRKRPSVRRSGRAARCVGEFTGHPEERCARASNSDIHPSPGASNA